MIGTQKMQDNYDGEFKTQTGTIIGSFAGGVTIAAGAPDDDRYYR